MRTHYRLSLLVAAALALGACAPMLFQSPSQPDVAGPAFAPVDSFGFEGGRGAVGESLSEAPASSAAEARERLVVQTAHLTMVVSDPVAKASAIRQLAEAMGGFVVSSNVYQSTVGSSGLTADYASITVRVPSERLSEALERIKADATEVRNESVSGEDVTAQYVDLESRLRNLQAAETQLIRIMDSAEKTEDVLAVYNELVRVRGEIEMVRGQMNYFEEAAALSAVTVELIPDEAAQPIDIGGWQPQGTAKAAVEALVRALQWLADAAIWLGICILPIGLLGGLPGLLILRSVRRRRARQAKTASAS